MSGESKAFSHNYPLFRSAWFLRMFLYSENENNFKVTIFRDQKIQLRPTIEEIRSKYYKELCRFLRIPDKFRGVQEDENVRINFTI